MLISKGLEMKLRDMFIPYITIGIIVMALMLLLFDEDKARGFFLTYTISYAAVMILLTVTK